MTLQKPSSSATPFVTSTIYSVLTMWTLVITSAQFTHQNCNLRTLPHPLLKCVISTHISRQAIQPHLSVSASTIREMTLHSGLSTFLIWTATFPPIQLTVFMGAIHSTKISGNFGPKLNGSVRSNRKSFEKTGPPFEVVLFSRSDRLEFWLNGSRPIYLNW